MSLSQSLPRRGIMLWKLDAREARTPTDLIHAGSLNWIVWFALDWSKQRLLVARTPEQTNEQGSTPLANGTRAGFQPPLAHPSQPRACDQGILSYLGDSSDVSSSKWPSLTTQVWDHSLSHLLHFAFLKAHIISWNDRFTEQLMSLFLSLPRRMSAPRGWRLSLAHSSPRHLE